MEKIRGKIEDKIFKEGETNGKAWRRCEFTIDGLKYSTFDQAIMDHFKVGEFVEMDGERKGKYFNMKSMKEIDPKEIESKPEPLIEVQRPGEIKSKDLRIVRMNSITNEINLMASQKAAISVDQAIDIARQFVNFVLEG